MPGFSRFSRSPFRGAGESGNRESGQLPAWKILDGGLAMTHPTRREIQSALAFYSGAPMPAPALPRKNARPEAACLLEVLKALRGHPAVSWCERQNSGAFKDGNRFVRFGWPGCSDILGQLRDGRFLAVEVKAPGGKPSEAQSFFLDRVRAAGGVSFIATSAADVTRNLSSECA